MQIGPSIFELVQCRLTLYYNYWQMNELLEAFLPEGAVVPTDFETVGHIAHLNLRDKHLPFTRNLLLKYWNSRLVTERQRLISCFSNSDVVCDVFSVVGPIAISAAKKVKYVYANDLNPLAVDYLERNIVLNKLNRKIEVSNMEGRRFIHSVFANQRAYTITQVVMNLPKDAAEFLDCFQGIFRKRPNDIGRTLPKIHVYGFSKAENPEFDFHEWISMALCETVGGVEMHRVRLVAPGKWMLGNGLRIEIKTSRRLEKMELVTGYWSPWGALQCELALVKEPQSASLSLCPMCN